MKMIVIVIVEEGEVSLEDVLRRSTEKAMKANVGDETASKRP